MIHGLSSAADGNADFQYPGTELELFANATNWKCHFRSRLSKYIHGDVCEVGAGIGATTQTLCQGTERSWLCLEPDPRLAGKLQAAINEEAFELTPEVQIGCLTDMAPDRRFDTILYIDVLEHIEDDRGELELAAKFLAPQGRLIVLCPAHQFLYSQFDSALGHFRRYDKRMFRAAAPSALECENIFYLDSMGLLLSLGNRLLLRQSMPSLMQIMIWDRLFVRCSRILDPLTGWQFGKSIVAVWVKTQ